MKTLITFLILLPSVCFAQGNLSKIDNELLFPEWSGPRVFVDHLNSQKIEPCEYLEGAEQRFNDGPPTIRRILMALAYAPCSANSSLAMKYMDSPDPLLKASAIRLASTLPRNIKRTLTPRVLQLQKTDSDPAVTAAIVDFLAK